MRLAVVTTHPIQYYAPLFRLLAKEPGIELKVFYTWSQSQQGAKYDIDFGKMIEWDIPLLDGYSYEFVNNVAKDPGLTSFQWHPESGSEQKDHGMETVLPVDHRMEFQQSPVLYAPFQRQDPGVIQGRFNLTGREAGFEKNIQEDIFKMGVQSYRLCIIRR